MAGEVEIDRMVVRLMGNDQQYVKTIDNSIKHTDRFVRRVGTSLKSLGSSMRRFGRSWSTFVTLPITALGTASVIAGANFQKAFTGVQKTVDATAMELEALRIGFKELALEIPLSVEELLGIGEAAGQLGIQTENILEFTRTMAALGVSTNLTSEEAATSFARFANIVGMSQTQFSNLGSSVVALGNSLATTEQEIVAMSMRLAGAGSTIGLSESQILAFAATLSSVGLQAEAGGTSFSKLFLNIQTALALGNKDLEEFARVSNKTVGQFSKDFRDDAAGAVRDLLAAIGELGPEAKVIALEDLGLAESVRMTDSILRTSGAIEKLDKALADSEKAFRENTALTEEAAKAYDTFWSKVTLLKNTIKDELEKVFVLIEPTLRKIIDHVVKLAAKFGEFSEETRKTVIWVLAIAAVVGPALIAMGGVISMVGVATIGLATLGPLLAPLIPIIVAVVAVIVTVTATIVLWGKEIKEVLQPAFEDLMAVIRDDVIPLIRELASSFKDLTRSNIGEVFGGVALTKVKVFAVALKGIATSMELIVDGVRALEGFGKPGILGGSGSASNIPRLGRNRFEQIPRLGGTNKRIIDGPGDSDNFGVNKVQAEAIRSSFQTAPVQSIQAARFGGAEALSRIAAYRSGRGASTKGPEERTANATEETVDLLGDIKEKLQPIAAAGLAGA